MLMFVVVVDDDDNYNNDDGVVAPRGLCYDGVLFFPSTFFFSLFLFCLSPCLLFAGLLYTMEGGKEIPVSC
jgi:hypothetical protein